VVYDNHQLILTGIVEICRSEREMSSSFGGGEVGHLREPLSRYDEGCIGEGRCKNSFFIIVDASMPVLEARNSFSEEWSRFG
jgi:hypothetical protein